MAGAGEEHHQLGGAALEGAIGHLYPRSPGISF
jgi:hypothetical protein